MPCSTVAMTMQTEEAEHDRRDAGEQFDGRLDDLAHLGRGELRNVDGGGKPTTVLNINSVKTLGKQLFEIQGML